MEQLSLALGSLAYFRRLLFPYKKLHLLKLASVFCCCLVAQSCLTLATHRLQLARLLCPWNFPGKDTRVGCHFLFQEIFQIQGSNSCLLHWQADSLPLSHQGRPHAFYILHKFPKSTFKESQNTFRNPFLERKGMFGNKISAILKDNQNHLAQH